MTTPREDARPTDTTYLAVLDPLDRRSVLNLVRIGPIGGVEEFKPYVGWRSNWALADDLDGPYAPPTAELSEAEALDIIDRIRPPHPDRAATAEEAVTALEDAFKQSQGRDRSGSIEFDHVYCQWLDVRTHVQVELTSNAYLPPDRRLALAEQLQVAMAGMVPPDLNGPNWSWAVTSPEGFHIAACAVVGALGVYRVTPDEIVGQLTRDDIQDDTTARHQGNGEATVLMTPKACTLALADTLDALKPGDSLGTVLDGVQNLAEAIYAAPRAFSIDEQSNRIWDQFKEGPVDRALNAAVARGALTEQQARKLQDYGTSASWSPNLATRPNDL